MARSGVVGASRAPESPETSQERTNDSPSPIRMGAGVRAVGYSWWHTQTAPEYPVRVGSPGSTASRYYLEMTMLPL
jgi:hypothetical protein